MAPQATDEGGRTVLIFIIPSIQIQTKGNLIMEQSITFRRIAAGDREEFLAMSREFYTSEAVLHPIPDDHHARAFDELMRSDAYLVCYIMELAGQAVGYALLTKTYSREAGGLNVWVDELYLRPGYRGLGAGSAFFAFLEQAHPAARYRLETEPENKRAQSLYRRMGYRDLPYLQMVKGE